MKQRIRVEVAPGIFSRERSASFEVNGQDYNMIVEESSLEGDTMEVRVVAEGEKEALIDLPRDTFMTGNRLRVPKTILLPA